jgi:hypothetical protein
LSALTKIVLFDIALAWEKYAMRRDRRNEESQQNLINQQNMLVVQLNRLAESYRISLGELDEGLHRFAHTLSSSPPSQVLAEFETLDKSLHTFRDNIGNGGSA